MYLFASDTQGPYVKKSDLKDKTGCSKRPFTMALPGYTSVQDRLSLSNCSLEATNNITSNADGTFTHSVFFGVLPPEYNSTSLVQNKQVLLQGSTLLVRHGFNWYANNGRTAALLDYWESQPYKWNLDGAQLGFSAALATSVAALAALSF